MSINNSSFCFLCAPFNKIGGSGARKSQSPNLNLVGSKHLLKYLVGFESGLAKGNLELNRNLWINRNKIVFCSRCKSLADKVSSLHLELEVVQMKINNLVEIIKQLVIGVTPDNSTVHTPFFNLMCQFREEVAKNGMFHCRKSIPIVSLHKCSHIPLTTLPGVDLNKKLCKIKHEPNFDPNQDFLNGEELDLDFKPHQVESDNYLECDKVVISQDFDESMNEDSDYTPEEKTLSNKRAHRHKECSPKSATTTIHKPKRSTSKLKKREKSYVPQTCQLCSNLSLNLRAFEQHLRTHETTEYSHLCPHCSLQFTHEPLFKLHLESHNTTRKCDICLEPVISAEMLTHIKTHQETTFDCPDCSYVFGKFSSFVRHTKLHNKKPIKCQLCPADNSNMSPWYTTRPKLITHLYRDHKTSDMYPCDDPLCSRAFFTEGALLSHMKTHVSKTPNKHQCDVCPLSFHEERLLITHKIKCHGASKLVCQICSKQYSNQSSLRRHTQSHKLDKDGKGTFPCLKCDKVFKTKGYLWAHAQVHKEKQFSCDVCGYLAVSSKYLQRHKLKHIQVKKFACSICSKRFGAKVNLTAHMRTHSSKQPYQCDKCGLNFAISGHLKNHLDTAH